MNSQIPDAPILPLGKDDIDVSARLLARSFATDPLFYWFFSPGPDREKHVELFCRFMVTKTLLCGHPAACTRGADGSLQGIAIAEDCLIGFLPRIRNFLVELSLYPAYLRPLGKRTLERMQIYRKVSHRAQKRRFSMYLVMVGVAPEARGLGYGKTLVRSVQVLDRARVGASGVGLDTENETNVGLYRHLGFTLEATTELDGLKIFVFHDHKGEAVP